MVTRRKMPRTLRVTFEFQIPEGTPTNVRTDKRMAAVGDMATAVAAIAGRALPPETTMSYRDEWTYTLHDKTTGPVTLGPPADPAP
ncbi:hypothetical protein [Streptomyces sp. CL12-4]|uniref:hypothetical protein n=1 Tax=Streptomyces sp. CL12-4 TaxID=2810306 RepID=UPI001EFBC956|nr:hypothetical protein [Streptomyces sp. CL12-4]MCG8971793.1 hypothetical protein [Streptomyces sp. CL12-4]